MSLKALNYDQLLAFKTQAKDLAMRMASAAPYELIPIPRMREVIGFDSKEWQETFEDRVHSQLKRLDSNKHWQSRALLIKRRLRLRHKPLAILDRVRRP